MNTLYSASALFRKAKDSLARGVRFFYKAAIEPRSLGEDDRRHELIFNIIASTVLAFVVILGIFVIYGEFARGNYEGIPFRTFALFILFFGGLLFLSRKGHAPLAAILFIGLYFLGATYGIYRWGIELPLSLLSYATIIVISSTLLGTRASFIVTTIICATYIGLGYLEVTGAIASDLAWRRQSLEWKDTFEGTFIFVSIMVVSWLSNRDLEKSLRRARRSEAALKLERDSLEIRIEERTKELKAAQLEKVSQLYKFVEFGRLSSGIFHDILNPLTTMALSVEELQKEGGAAGPEAREGLERALRASKRIESFIQTAKKQLDSEGKKEIFALENEIRDAIDLLLHKSRVTGVEIRADLEGPTLIYGNSVKFFQIAANLISNAIDSYASAAKDEEKAVSVTLTESPAGIRFEVRDSGCGIPDDLHKAVFDPFFTTKAKEAGMGLGLSTTKAIVEKDFGGTIQFLSAPGRGSTFTVLLPRERKAPDRRRRSIPRPDEHARLS
jgi:signal transduction histidine kinase